MTVPTGASTSNVNAQQSALAHQQQPAQHLNGRLTRITSYNEIPFVHVKQAAKPLPPLSVRPGPQETKHPEQYVASKMKCLSHKLRKLFKFLQRFLWLLQCKKTRISLKTFEMI